MIPAIPIGWRMLIAHLSGSSDGVVSPNIRRPSPAIRYAMSMPSWTSPRASDRTLPISRVIARASRSLCCGHQRAEARRGSRRAWGRACAATSAAPSQAALTAIADVGRGPLLEPPDDVARVGRIAALERGAARGLAPLPGDEVAERRDVGRSRAGSRCGRWRTRLGHGGECSRPPERVSRVAAATRGSEGSCSLCRWLTQSMSAAASPSQPGQGGRVGQHRLRQGTQCGRQSIVGPVDGLEDVAGRSGDELCSWIQSLTPSGSSRASGHGLTGGGRTAHRRRFQPDERPLAPAEAGAPPGP